MKKRVLLTLTLLAFVLNINYAQVALSGVWTSTTSAANVHASGAGANRMLVYVIAYEDNDNTNDVTAVTYGGQNLTQAMQANLVVGGAGSQNRVEIWYLLEAKIAMAVGTTYTPTFSISDPSTSHGYYTSSATLTGVNQVTPVCTTGSGTNTAASTVNLSAAISFFPSEMMIYATSEGDNHPHTPAAGFTEQADLTGAGGGQGYSLNTRAIAASGPQNPTETITGGTANRLVMGAIRVIPNGGTCISGLPIELTSFEANLNQDKVDIYWSTASEINNDYFTIERSKDGELWAEIARVPGAGNSNQHLEYMDADYSPLKGTSYYRLKQTDYNGEYTYSQIVVIKNGEAVLAQYDITPFPNPNDGNSFNLEFTGFSDEEVLLVVRDILGKTYFSKVYVVNDNSNIVVVSLEQKLPTGTYLVVASSNDNLVSRKIVVK